MTSTLTRPATTLMDQGQINEALTLIYSGQWEGPNGTTLEEFEKCITAEFLDNQHTYVAELFCDEEEDEEDDGEEEDDDESDDEPEDDESDSEEVDEMSPDDIAYEIEALRAELDAMTFRPEEQSDDE